MKTMTDEQRSEVGEKWADILNMKKSREHPDRYDMRGGTRTALGVYLTQQRLVNENGEHGLID